MTSSTTPTIPTRTITRAIHDVMLRVGHVGKNGRNIHFGYNFRGIDGVLNAVGPALRECGVVVTPEVLDATTKLLEGRSRSGDAVTTAHTTVRVAYTWRHVDGDDTITVTVTGEAMDSGDKSVSKAMAVTARIMLIQTLMIPTDETDPDVESPQIPVRERQQRQGATPTPVQATPVQATPTIRPLTKNAIRQIVEASSVETLRDAWRTYDIDEFVTDLCPDFPVVGNGTLGALITASVEAVKSGEKLAAALDGPWGETDDIQPEEAPPDRRQ